MARSLCEIIPPTNLGLAPQSNGPRTSRSVAEGVHAERTDQVSEKSA